MKTNTVFESKMREANYASLDVFRGALRSHPLVADYVCDLLIARGVVALREDGSVVGVVGEGESTARGKRAAVSARKGEWKDHWPERGELIDCIRGYDEDGTISFGDLQTWLKELGEPHGHWIVLHALWNLMEAGIVRKEGKKYSLTETGDETHPTIAEAITRALKKAGPPYKLEAVLGALREIPGHNFFGRHSAHSNDPTTQQRVDSWIDSRKQQGLL